MKNRMKLIKAVLLLTVTTYSCEEDEKCADCPAVSWDVTICAEDFETEAQYDAYVDFFNCKKR